MQGLRIHDVADQTKIRGDHIRALEEGDYDVFSAPVYIRGFVRTYAGLLKLDVKLILEALNKELALSGQAEPSLSPPERGMVDKAMFHLAKFSRRAALLVALVVMPNGSLEDELLPSAPVGLCCSCTLPPVTCPS